MSVSIEDFKEFGTQKKFLLDPPHIIYLLHENDKIVSDFCEKIMPRLVDPTTKMMDKGKALTYLAVYTNGIETRKSHEHFSQLKMKEKDILPLIEILKKPIPELKSYGQAFIQLAHMQFSLYAKKWWNEERYKKIYKSDSFFKWIKKIEEYPDVDSGQTMLEFHDFQNIDKKVQDILTTQIKI